MAVYEYTAKDEDGNKFTSTCSDINSVAALRGELAKMGNTLVSAKRSDLKKKKQQKVKQDEIIAFLYKLAAMCSAGLPITESLETIEEEIPNLAFKQILSDIRESIEKGATLKDAFGKHKNIFSNFFIGMLEVAQSSGKLAETIEMSASYMEEQADRKCKVMSAFTYPIVVGVMCIVVVSAIVIFIVPVFSKLYRQLHAELPMETQLLVYLSLMIRQRWWLIALVAVAVAVLIRKLQKSPHWKVKWDAFKLNMPIFAGLYRMAVVSRLMRTFAMLASAGISFIEALDIANVVANNSKVSEVTNQVQQSIEQGNSVADSLRKHDIFPPSIIQLVASGEKAGALPEMLNKGIDLLDKEIDRTIKALLVRLEPAMTLIMGIIVGFILIAVYSPMIDYMSHLK